MQKLIEQLIKWLVNFAKVGLARFAKVEGGKRSYDFVKVEDVKFNTPKLKTDFEKLKFLIIDNGGVWVKGKPFFWGIRNESKPGVFNDLVGVLFHEKVLFSCIGTTDPGLPWIKDPIRGLEGCSILCKGIYNDFWILGDRESFRKYVSPTPSEFLVFRQNGSRVRYRVDVNKNGKIDADEPVVEKVGYPCPECQFHPMGFDDNPNRTLIGRWSAMCQGPRLLKDFYAIRNTAEMWDARYEGKRQRYSYALFDDTNPKLSDCLKRKIKRINQ